MPHLEKVLAHAEKELAPPGIVAAGELQARLPQYRRFLKIENHRLRLAHQAGGGGLEICRRRVGLLDVFLKQLYTDACQACLPDERYHAAPAALLAIGGYGRGELNPFSDVDVLFLHDFAAEKVPEAVNELIKQILYVLWDIGFKVGHATRSIKDTCTPTRTTFPKPPCWRRGISPVRPDFSRSSRHASNGNASSDRKRATSRGGSPTSARAI